MLHTSEVKGELWASVRKATETPRIHGAAEESFYVLIYPPPGVWFPHLSTALTKETPHSHVRSDNVGVCPPEGALPLSYWPTQLMERLLQRRMLGWGELVNPSAEEQERARDGCRKGGSLRERSAKSSSFGFFWTLTDVRSFCRRCVKTTKASFSYHLILYTRTILTEN